MSARKRTCAVCRAPVVAKYSPFCSARCAEVDLGRWLKGTYRIPTNERPENGSEIPDDAASGDTGDD